MATDHKTQRRSLLNRKKCLSSPLRERTSKKSCTSSRKKNKVSLFYMKTRPKEEEGEEKWSFSITRGAMVETSRKRTWSCRRPFVHGAVTVLLVRRKQDLFAKQVTNLQKFFLLCPPRVALSRAGVNQLGIVERRRATTLLGPLRRVFESRTPTNQNPLSSILRSRFASSFFLYLERSAPRSLYESSSFIPNQHTHTRLYFPFSLLFV